MTSSIEDSLEHLSAGFSLILNTKIVSDDEDKADVRLSGSIKITELFEFSYSGSYQSDVASEAAPKRKNFDIRVKNLYGKVNTHHVNGDSTIAELKRQISEDHKDCPPYQLRLTFEGRQLADGKTLLGCNIRENSTLQVVACIGGKTAYQLDATDLDPQYDYDFTAIKDKVKFERGGQKYERPCGYKRIALRVKGKYENDRWLGGPGYRTHSSPGEWPVSYHGTTNGDSLHGIVKEGYDSRKWKRELHGKGHYSSPAITTAAQYAATYTLKGKKYEMVLQNRVNMASTKVIGTCYITTYNEHLRPYGVCIKEK